ncbi:MAG: hypothetical protein FRX49_10031 [Trebouxia sp. A1-2]|nr:MAG: hypothetical protein FRX49_10031 [Trebouxia sp. A1-2]
MGEGALIDTSHLLWHSGIKPRCVFTSQRAQAQRSGSEYKVVSNWNGTIELPKYEFGDKVLQEGSFGGDVLELQRFLNDQGYFPRLRETPDGYTGYFGDLTKEALQAWQEDYHLAADGQFGHACRQAVARQQQEIQLEHVRKQHVVPHKAPVPERHLSPVQVAGVAFLLGGVAMFVYQVWAWWRHSQQANGHVNHDLQDDRQQQLGKWRGTISEDRSRPTSPSPSYASYAATRSSQATGNFAAASSSYPRAAPPPPLARPLNRGSSPPSSSSPNQDAIGPAVSLEGYPRYSPQWGVGLPEQKKVAPPTPVRREPSERAKQVMTRPGTPPYPKPAAGSSKAVSGGPRVEPPGHARQDNAQVGKQAGPLYDQRPRSPNPNAMPKSLTTTPPLKPSLDPSAKSWVEIAVSQRGSGGSPRSGQRAEGIARNGAQQKQPAPPGSNGSGVAQVLSVDEERRSGHNRNGRAYGDASSSKALNSGRSQGSSGAGVSLFGSYKAPFKRQ